MAKIYYNLIMAGKRTLDQVPSKWRTEVEAMLNASNSAA